MRPVDIAIGETLTFLRGVLPAPPARVLDVGCGPGDLAVRLRAEGYRVTALDINADAALRAREAGLDAVEEDFIFHQGGPYDVVLFSRSLHHIYPLEEAVARAHELLALGGLLVTEEFAYEAADRATACWFFDMQLLLDAAGVLSAKHEHVPVSGDPLERWRVLYAEDHAVHPGTAMVSAIEHQFTSVLIEKAPYLYRTFTEWLDDNERGYGVIKRLLEMEQHQITNGTLAIVGLRMVAQRTT